MNFRRLLLTVSLMIITGCQREHATPNDPALETGALGHTNVVVIVIDDLGWTDAGFMGSDYYETPNIDRLASRGMIFTNAYANAANCAPSRASILTGQYTPKHGVFTVNNSDRGESRNRRLITPENTMIVPLENHTIAERLKPAGYKTASIGKWNIGHKPTERGFDIAIDRGQTGYRHGYFNDEGEYYTDRLTKEASSFIAENHDSPFFLYLAHHAVHLPIEAKEVLIEKYQRKHAPGCQNNAEYAAMIESVDASVGAVSRQLEDLNILDDTMIVFFSDNGGYGRVTCVDPLRGSKGMFYEGGIRVPMFVHWPGKIKPGATSDVPVMSADIFPTLMEAAHIPRSDKDALDGISLVPLLQGKDITEPRNLYWYFPAYLESSEGLASGARDSNFRVRPVSAIRKGDWKLLLFHEEWSLDGGEQKVDVNNSVELYNIKADVGESKNLASTEKSRRDELLSDLLRWHDQVGAPILSEANPNYQLTVAK